MNFYCAPPSELRAPTKDTVRVSLYEDIGQAGVGSAGTGLVKLCKRAQIGASLTAWDLVSIALAVVSADGGAPRATSPDGWTRDLSTTVALADPAPWVARKEAIERLLSFLTGDIWRLQFVGNGVVPTISPVFAGPEEAVVLLSGGMDSLVGAIDAATAGRRLFAVSQVAAGDKTHQKRFASSIGGGLRHLQLNHNSRPPGSGENSQRARSFVFIAFGVLAATSLSTYAKGGRVDLLIPENGFISLNVPLTPMRIGSLSTRTTHPFYVREMQGVLDAVGLRVRLLNPYQHHTKGEMLAGCKDQALLKRLVDQSTSCGRFTRNNFTHCGRCVPCLIRRAAFNAWGRRDSTQYVYADLSVDDVRHKHFDDVRSVGMAIETVRLKGIDSWAGSALSSAQLGNLTPYRDLLKRSLKEIKQYLKSARAL